jgi:glycine C-acetyltransferase
MKSFLRDICNELEAKKTNGTLKKAPVLAGKMSSVVTLSDGREVVNLCSNNYLGLSSDLRVSAAAKQAIDEFGNGTSSVRFICGSFTIHEELERTIADFLGMEKATTYLSCWNANEALIPSLLNAGDAVISDSLNHASIIDACRLCGKKVQRCVYKHSDMSELEQCLQQVSDSPRKLIVTDGVFSMEGDLANLGEIVKLAGRYDALVAVDDSHAHGVIGRTGRGTPEYFGVKVDIVTGTLGKALGGACGGFVASYQEVIDLLVQNSRPQLFSNALPPSMAATGCQAIKSLTDEPERIVGLQENVRYLREGLGSLGYEVIKSPSAILPVIVKETSKAITMAKKMLEKGVLITGFGYPVVPEGQARLRAQVCALHTKKNLDKVIGAFAELKQEFP